MFETKRFWSGVVVGSPENCWPWTKALFHGGHGAVTVNGKSDRAHRVAWTLTNGPIPDGMCVLHRCDNPPCCNPTHLFIGTKTDNARDRDAKGRQARGIRNGKHTKPERTPRGERGRAKLTAGDVLTIRCLRADGVIISDIAARFDIGASQVSRVVRRQAWAHI